MPTTSPPKATSTSSTGEGGTCGRQHNNARCLLIDGSRLCCSVNGFCGDDPTYCLAINDCQSDCTDGPNRNSSISSIPSLSSSITSMPSTFITSTTALHNSSSTSSLLTTSTSSAPNGTSTESPHSGLSGKKKTGVIAGSVVGGVFLLILLIWLVKKFCFPSSGAKKVSGGTDGAARPRVTRG